jgi:hypothetical protein
MEIINPSFNRKSIWKYTLGSGENIFQIPKGYRVLSVIEQHGAIVLYCLVDPSEEVVSAEFTLIGTGWELDNSILDMNFIGTVVIQGGYTVCHVFEKVIK